MYYIILYFICIDEPKTTDFIIIYKKCLLLASEK